MSDVCENCRPLLDAITAERDRLLALYEQENLIATTKDAAKRRAEVAVIDAWDKGYVAGVTPHMDRPVNPYRAALGVTE